MLEPVSTLFICTLIGSKRALPSAIQGRWTALSTAGLKKPTISLFLTDGSVYTDLRVGSRLSCSVVCCWIFAELMYRANA